MKHLPVVLGLLIVVSSCKTARYASVSPGRISTDRRQYIEKYRDIAISEMKRTGVPASITLAQGLLESDNGNSTLAVKANNHFGIKCHNDWNGQRIYHDDDARNECFRKYKSPYDSYRDHSNFLRDRERYASLFELPSTDYKGWAHGLKKAGYATNREYATLLIRIIEENSLQAYDKGKITASVPDTTGKPDKVQKVSNEQVAGQVVTDIDNFTVDLGYRNIEQLNRIEYIRVRAGDTFISLAEEFDMMYWELFKYNELSRDAVLVPDQLLFLQPKRNRAEHGHDYHIVTEGDTMYSISQQYGIKLGRLYKMNPMEVGSEPSVGQKLWLRKTKPAPEGNVE